MSFPPRIEVTVAISTFTCATCPVIVTPHALCYDIPLAGEMASKWPNVVRTIFEHCGNAKIADLKAWARAMLLEASGGKARTVTRA